MTLSASPHPDRPGPHGELPTPILQGRDFLSSLDLSAGELRTVLDTAHSMKRGEWRGTRPLAGLALALIFEKASLRTRTTFDVGMYQLGGHAITLSNQEIGLGSRERVADVARNLERWVDGVMGRVYEQTTLIELAECSSVPVINGLSDALHPVQLLADYQTIEERFPDTRGVRIAFLGDGNNLANSHIEMARLTGASLTVCTPVGHEPNGRVLMEALKAGAEVRLTHDVNEAVTGAQVLYTDVWISMGQESEAERKKRVFYSQGFQVTPDMLERIAPEGIFLHCLPAHYGEEVVPEATEHAKSFVFDQAENRLHAQKALLYHILGGQLPRW
ncbi:ornithine carbamoyltransferase [Deinococcus peraridilitoris]|uniref:Ornithine carbamoyltransferase n=1 Tax=Deinococcus peraridilitoris (strain DSM 19664 / LMG 22246 / CIP 109416 / KR-200) TaxID=937777 RepID=L0A2P9_DEIPD|nr:ornithine carbamoyltransferase [Deinococcus peraridilitoris]AFZ68153.1 ornithine carbamoyltransferase [Deinococcus peraridilitoris DSM 19664]